MFFFFFIKFQTFVYFFCNVLSVRVWRKPNIYLIYFRRIEREREREKGERGTDRWIEGEWWKRDKAASGRCPFDKVLKTKGAT